MRARRGGEATIAAGGRRRERGRAGTWDAVGARCDPVELRVTTARLRELDEDVWLRLRALWPLVPAPAPDDDQPVLLAMVGPLLVGAAVRTPSSSGTFILRLAVGPRAPEAAAALAGACGARARGASTPEPARRGSCSPGDAASAGRA